jgi:hypothetical protein
VLTLAIGPFSQQAIRQYPCSKPHLTLQASIPATHVLSPAVAPRVDGVWDTAQPSLQDYLPFLNGLVNSLTETQDQVTTGCSTGNCTFQDYGGFTHRSFGLCSRCIDTTQYIQYAGQKGAWVSAYNMPNNLTIGSFIQDYDSGSSDVTLLEGNHTSTVNVSFPATQGTNYAFLNLQNDLFSIEGSQLTFMDTPDVILTSLANAPKQGVSVLQTSTAGCSLSTVDNEYNCSHAGLSIEDNDTSNLQKTFKTDTNLMATSCYFYPCLRTYFAEVLNGRFNENTVSTSPIPANLSISEVAQNISRPEQYYAMFSTPCIVNGLHYDYTNLSEIPQEAVSWINATSEANGDRIIAPIQCVYAANYWNVQIQLNFLRSC